MTKSAKILTALTFVLVVFGLTMLSSAGIVDGQKTFGSSYYYLGHQLLFGVLPGLALFFIFSRINYKFWRKISLPLLLVTTGLLVLVFVPGVGYGLKGAQRWVDIGFFRFQPSEFLKLALVVYLAAWFSRHDGRMNSGSYSIAPFFLVLGFAGLLLLLQPDMGTLVLVTIMAISMYFFAGVSIKRFIALILVVVLLLGVFSFLEPYRFNRLKSFINPAVDTQGTSYHINQALLGIGSGGVFGVGFGQSQQKVYNFLPEPVGDSIFAIIVEELGFVGAAILLGLFLALTLSMVQIAKNVNMEFGKLLVMGAVVWVSVQALINISAISGIIPLTGIPLPFISFGSSSLVSVLAMLGIVANVAQHS
ncbi:MAG: FtsW/RodA/SpoVE family cell cycle protein [Candidatus Paceibacterota bacterium]